MHEPRTDRSVPGEVTWTEADRWGVLARCLTVRFPRTVAPLVGAVNSVLAAGGVPFEAAAGTPFGRYGARLAVATPTDPQRVARAVGLAVHPWGPPDCLSVRARPDGTVRAKAYHWTGGFAGRIRLPPGAPDGLRPVMASVDGALTEAYLELRPAMPWAAFVAACLAPLGGEPIRFSPVPRTAERGFMVSYRWAGPRLDAVTVYALPPSLPPDRDIPGAWKEGMDEGARVDYETALAGVRGFGPPSHRGWHTLLGWTLDRDGTWHRAAGLRIPPATRAA